MDRKEFQKRWIMGTIQPELFYIPWKKGFSIYLEKVDEFGEEMSNVEFRIYRNNSALCYDQQKYHFTSPLSTEPFMKTAYKILENGKYVYKYEYDPSDYVQKVYEPHNFLNSPISIKNAKITNTTSSYVQFIPTSQPVIISGLKEGGYRLEEMQIFNSKYYYNMTTSYFALNPKGEIVSVKGLTIYRNNYNSWGKDYFSELNLPNSVFEKLENPNVEYIQIIKEDWITHYPKKVFSVINYEKLWSLWITGYSVEDINNIPDVSNLDKYSGNGDYIITSNRDVSNVEYVGRTNSTVHTPKITIDTDNNQIIAEDFLDDKLKGLRFAKYIYHETKPPIYIQGYYVPNSLILYYHNLPYDVIFELNKETQLITDINNTIYYNKTLNHFNLNLFHERPMLRFIASWIPVPSGVTKSYRGYRFSVNSADGTITCHENEYIDYKYGGQMLGIKIYCDGQYQGYYTRLFPTQYASSPEITHSSELTNILVPDYLSKSYQTSEITIITGNPHVSNYITERLITRNETLTNCNIWIDDDGYGTWYASIYANAEGEYKEINTTTYTDNGQTVVDNIQERTIYEGKNIIYDYDNGKDTHYNIFDLHYLNETGGYVDTPLPSRVPNGYYYLGDGLTKEKLSTYLDVANQDREYPYISQYEIEA